MGVDDNDAGHWYRIPYPYGILLFRVKTYKFEYTWGVSTWDKAYCGFCTSSLAISWCVLLTDLAVLANIEGQVSLIVQGLARHDGLWDLHS